MKIHLKEYSPRLYRKIRQCQVNFYCLAGKAHKSQKDWKRMRYWARVASKWCKKVDWSLVNNNVGHLR